MVRKTSDEVTLLREALADVMAKATEPMTSIEMAAIKEIRELGLPMNMVSMELAHMWARKKPEYPIARVPAAAGRAQHAYFNPQVVKLHYARPDPVNEVKSAEPEALPEFQFDPVQLTMDTPDPVPDAAPVVSVPAGAKTITLSVAGVTIKIELG